MILFYCLVVYAVHRTWLVFVLSMELVGILSLILLKVSVSVLVVVSHLYLLLCCMIILHSGHKLKYLGCLFNQSSSVDYCNSIQKFNGNFNNILSVLGHREMKYLLFI